MKNLHLSKELSLPLDAVTQTIAFLARKGAGKTYGASKLAEEMIDAGAQVAVIDPVGVWYGLRLAADGKGKGISIPVFGGLHGDVPLEATAGALVADLLVDKGICAVIDVSMFRKGDRKRFATDFAEQLFHRKKSARSAMHLFLEEAQVLVPQRVQADEARMLGAFEDIVKLGRNFGIGVTLISQRPQAVNKDALTQTECLIVLQTNGAQERKALSEWIVEQGLDVGELVDSLPGLQKGEAYVWSPSWLGLTKRIHISEKRTFNASATPEVGKREVVAKELAPVELDEIKTAMAATIERAAASDPAKLQKRIRELEAQLAKAPTKAVVETKIERVEVPAVSPQILEELRRRFEAAKAAHEMGSAPLVSIGKALDGIRQMVPAAAPKLPAHRAPVRGPVVAVVTKSRPPSGDQVDGEGLSGPQQRILDALGSFESMGLSRVKKGNVAVFADQSPSSSAFANNLGRLRTLGMISYPAGGEVALTDAGRSSARAETIGGLDELHAAWAKKLPRPQWAILERLILNYPDAVHREPLSEMVGQSNTSSAYANNLGALRSLGLIDYRPGQHVVATELVFPAALAAAS